MGNKFPEKFAIKVKIVEVNGKLYFGYSGINFSTLFAQSFFWEAEQDIRWRRNNKEIGTIPVCCSFGAGGPLWFFNHKEQGTTTKLHAFQFEKSDKLTFAVRYDGVCADFVAHIQECWIRHYVSTHIIDWSSCDLLSPEDQKVFFDKRVYDRLSSQDKREFVAPLERVARERIEKDSENPIFSFSPERPKEVIKTS
jgi:hypothetical protein